MPRKIRDLLREYKRAGCIIQPGGGKGSHRKIKHAKHAGMIIVSGKPGEDAKRYQEEDLIQFLEEIDR